VREGRPSLWFCGLSCAPTALHCASKASRDPARAFASKCCRMAFKKELIGDFVRGSLHGGSAAGLMDTCGGIAAWSVLPDMTWRVGKSQINAHRKQLGDAGVAVRGGRGEEARGTCLASMHSSPPGRFPPTRYYAAATIDLDLGYMRRMAPSVCMTLRGAATRPSTTHTSHTGTHTQARHTDSHMPSNLVVCVLCSCRI
jgi:acyl-coenzyme A thioesterase PaaI-like protein